MNQLTEDQKLAVAEFAADQNGGNADEYVDDIVFTAEPVENFTALAERVKQNTNFGKGYILERVQRRKGAARTTIYMLDFGNARGIYEI